ncbi:histidine ammonia-lyase [Vulgatibacter incomptus]|uniref:Histidine ammonia-lyase n=1 Tax=Vulgatibacter incomptus TaxID=1391653 RepID=A0A0K1PAG1_9BACT|nr:histidine ammonia-lyase [Vulgatibacter incomptus]AKU90505.1 Histidine ammonia-lyase [Vulgatibacter incomptus]
MDLVLLDGDTLELAQLERIANGHCRVGLAPSSMDRLRKARALVDEIAAGDKAAYGINTGFGTLAEVRIAKGDLKQLQRNLILSHAAGVGEPLPPMETRALMTLRANVLAKGHSGVRPSTVETLLELINRNVLPVVPSRGSVGASGDLAPLAHLALTLIGEGEALFEGQRMPSRMALEKAGLAPVVLEAKEGLALINGTQAIGSVGGPAVQRAGRLLEIADIAGAMTVEALMGSHKPFIPQIHEVRPQPGQIACAANLRRLLADSEIVEAHKNCAKVQDPYSLRCMPQVHGAARDGVRFAREALAIEINCGTDNPLVFADEGLIVSGGNFHGQPVSQALDVLAIAVTQLAAISERRVEQLVNPALSGLPPFLTENSGLNSGFMIAQVTAAALVAESRVLCHPACVDSIPSSAGREDHVSMGMGAALKARQVVEHVRSVLAIELLASAQALDMRKGLRPGVGVAAAHEVIRSEIPHMDNDRELHLDIAAVSRMIDDGRILAAVEAATA